MQLIKTWFADTKHSAGLTLIEAVVATALLGIGFAGVYTISAVSMRSMDQAVARQKLQMQANQILDTIDSDIANIDSYTMQLTTCAAPAPGAATSLVRQFEWCSRLTGEVGAAVGAEQRTVTVTTLADGRKVVHVLLESDNQRVQIVMKRIYDS